MIGSNIKKLRTEKGMTQKALADQLFVSPQAVSRWENNEVEPSLGTIAEMAKIFGVSTDMILGVDNGSKAEEPEVIIEKEYVYKEAPKMNIALCEECNKPLYTPDEIVRVDDGKIICKSCEEKRNTLAKIKEKEALNKKLYKAQRRRTLSFIWGGIAAGIILFPGILIGICMPEFTVALGFIAFTALASAMLFCYVSCFILKNNFLGEMTLEIISFGFVKMPGLIFELDIDGCMWFIGMKVLFWVIEIGLAILAALLAFAVGMMISIFVYPFALVKNINRPEDTNDLF